MLINLLCASEFVTKLIAGLSGAIFAVLILVLAIRSKNKVKPEDSPAETKRRAKKQNEEVLQAEQNKKNKKKKHSEEDVIANDTEEQENE